MQNAAFRFGLIASLLVFGLGSLEASEKAHRKPNTTINPSDSSDKAHPPAGIKPMPSSPKGGVFPSSIEDPPEPTEYKYRCDPSPNREDADSCAQRESAQWAKGQFWVGFFGMFVGAAAAFYTWRAAIAARDAAVASKASAEEAELANKQAHSLFISENRPWINVASAQNGSISFGRETTTFGVEFIIENIGQSPANSVHYSFKVFLGSTNNITDIVSNFCELVVGGEIIEQKEGVTLFPGRNIKCGHLMCVDNKAIDEAAFSIKSTKTEGGMNMFFYATVIGCVVYRIGDGAIKYTGCAFHFCSKITDPPGEGRWLSVGGTVMERGSVSFSQHGGGSIAV